ncbi:MAG: hypothetical protein ACJ8F7_16105, partial [Gemmataceae bacterium]
ADGKRDDDGDEIAHESASGANQRRAQWCRLSTEWGLESIAQPNRLAEAKGASSASSNEPEA